MRLHEQYRPRTWTDVVGQDKGVRKVLAVAKRGLGGHAFWITGASGTGKTTFARLIAEEIADPFCTIEIDASDLTPARLRSMESELFTYGFGVKTGRAYIINEARGLKHDTIRRLFVLLDSLPSHVVFIFTSTKGDEQQELFCKPDDPLVSRCTTLPLARIRSSVAAPVVREIAQAEGLDGKPLTAYSRLVRRCNGNLRAVLQAIEAGDMMEEGT